MLLAISPSIAFRDTLSAFFIGSLLFTSQLMAAEEINLDSRGHILKGYDPVTYFDGKPVPGNNHLGYEYQGARYLFSTAENREKFIENPTHYAPEFGGYCAYGIRMGKKLNIDPLAYAIEDNKLYVLPNRATLQTWSMDRTKNIRIADNNWPKLKPISAAELEAEE